MLCLDLWSDIIEFSEFEIKLKILKLSDSHYNYGFIIKEIPENNNLTNNILKQKKYHKLQNLTICHNKKITDEGIKHMQLHTLNATGNSKITDEGQRDLLKNLVF